MLNSIMTKLNFTYSDILNGGVGIMGLVEFQMRAQGAPETLAAAGELSEPRIFPK